MGKFLEINTFQKYFSERQFKIKEINKTTTKPLFSDYHCMYLGYMDLVLAPLVIIIWDKDIRRGIPYVYRYSFSLFNGAFKCRLDFI